MTKPEELCGRTIDLFPQMPGNIVHTCARPVHSSRAWHQTADGKFAWKDRAVTEQCPSPGCDVRLPPGWDQAEHMTQHHPEILQQRLAKVANDGWVQD